LTGLMLSEPARHAGASLRRKRESVGRGERWFIVDVKHRDRRRNRRERAGDDVEGSAEGDGQDAGEELLRTPRGKPAAS
jgi:hypothetical protein